MRPGAQTLPTRRPPVPPPAAVSASAGGADVLDEQPHTGPSANADAHPDPRPSHAPPAAAIAGCGARLRAILMLLALLLYQLVEQAEEADLAAVPDVIDVPQARLAELGRKAWRPTHPVLGWSWLSARREVRAMPLRSTQERRARSGTLSQRNGMIPIWSLTARSIFSSCSAQPDRRPRRPSQESGSPHGSRPRLTMAATPRRGPTSSHVVRKPSPGAGMRLIEAAHRISQRYGLTHCHPGSARTAYPKSQSCGFVFVDKSPPVACWRPLLG